MVNIEVSEGKPDGKPRKDLKSARRRPSLSYLRRNLKTVVVAILVVGLAVFVFEYIHTRDQLRQLSNPKAAAQNEAQDLTGRIGKLVLLPAGETPTVATVSDASKLQAAGFKDAQDGDKLLIYPKANKAVLYRPSINRVIQYSTVNLGSGT